MNKQTNKRTSEYVAFNRFLCLFSKYLHFSENTTFIMRICIFNNSSITFADQLFSRKISARQSHNWLFLTIQMFSVLNKMLQSRRFIKCTAFRDESHFSFTNHYSESFVWEHSERTCRYYWSYVPEYLTLSKLISVIK